MSCRACKMSAAACAALPQSCPMPERTGPPRRMHPAQPEAAAQATGKAQEMSALQALAELQARPGPLSASCGCRHAVMSGSKGGCLPMLAAARMGGLSLEQLDACAWPRPPQAFPAGVVVVAPSCPRSAELGALGSPVPQALAEPWAPVQAAEADAEQAAALAARLAPLLFDEGSSMGGFLRSQRAAFLKALHLLQVGWRGAWRCLVVAGQHQAPQRSTQAVGCRSAGGQRVACVSARHANAALPACRSLRALQPQRKMQRANPVKQRPGHLGTTPLACRASTRSLAGLCSCWTCGQPCSTSSCAWHLPPQGRQRCSACLMLGRTSLSSRTSRSWAASCAPACGAWPSWRLLLGARGAHPPRPTLHVPCQQPGRPLSWSGSRLLGRQLPTACCVQALQRTGCCAAASAAADNAAVAAASTKASVEAVSAHAQTGCGMAGRHAAATGALCRCAQRAAGECRAVLRGPT